MQHEPYDLLVSIQEECAESIQPSFTIPIEFGLTARYATERIGNAVFVEDFATGMCFKVIADQSVRDEWNALGGTNSPAQRGANAACRG